MHNEGVYQSYVVDEAKLSFVQCTCTSESEWFANVDSITQSW